MSNERRHVSDVRARLLLEYGVVPRLPPLRGSTDGHLVYAAGSVGGSQAGKADMTLTRQRHAGEEWADSEVRPGSE